MVNIKKYFCYYLNNIKRLGAKMIRIFLFSLLLFLFSGCGTDYQALLKTPLGECSTQYYSSFYKHNANLDKVVKDANRTFLQIRLRTVSVDAGFSQNNINRTQTEYSGLLKYNLKAALETRYLPYINKYTSNDKLLYLDVKLLSASVEDIKDSNVTICNGQKAVFITVLYALQDDSNNTVWSAKTSNWGTSWATPKNEENTYWSYAYAADAFSKNPQFFYETFVKDIPKLQLVKLKVDKENAQELSRVAKEFTKTNDIKKLKETMHKNKASQSALPADVALAMVGPENLNINTIRSMLNEKIGEAIIISKIKRAKSGYKDFSTEEIHRLKAWGFSENIIAMMLDITTTLESNQGQAKKQEAQKSTVSAQQQQYYQQQNMGQSMGDKVVEKVTDKAVEKVGEMIFKRLF